MVIGSLGAEVIAKMVDFIMASKPISLKVERNKTKYMVKDKRT